MAASSQTAISALQSVLQEDFKPNEIEKPENLVGLSPSSNSEGSASLSPVSSSKPLQNRLVFNGTKDGQRKSISSIIF